MWERLGCHIAVSCLLIFAGLKHCPNIPPVLGDCLCVMPRLYVRVAREFVFCLHARVIVVVLLRWMQTVYLQYQELVKHPRHREGVADTRHQRNAKNCKSD